ALYQATHDRDQFVLGTDKLDRAVALRPSDTILLSNAGSVVFENALKDVLGPSIDWKALKRRADLSLVSFLYRDQKGEKKVADALRKHAGILKARGYLDRLLLLAPKRPYAYAQLIGLYISTDDEEA